MGTLSQYAEAKVLEHVVGKTSFTMPTVWLALCTVLPTSASTGATLTEANYTTYVRLATAGLWGSATPGTPSTIFNASAMIQAACTAGGSTIVGWALVDSVTIGAGNVLVWGGCASVVISSVQTPPTVAINGCEVTLS